MEFNQDFELHLNRITAHELSRNRKDYEEKYLSVVIQMLAADKKFLFAEDILKLYPHRQESLDQIITKTSTLIPDNGTSWPNPHQHGKYCSVYYDVMLDLYIEPHHVHYDLFFAYMMNHTDLLNIDGCLSYQLEKHYANNLKLFARFLHLIIRKHKDIILAKETTLTIEEWITCKQKEITEDELNGKERLKGKQNGQLKRMANDKFTCLNQQQTILLIHYLQKHKVLLRDEYLTAADAGKAFELITGYSQHTLRQDLGKYFQYENPENKENLRMILATIINDLDN
jgi:hypothetical protein